MDQRAGTRAKKIGRAGQADAHLIFVRQIIVTMGSCRSIWGADMMAS